MIKKNCEGYHMYTETYFSHFQFIYTGRAVGIGENILHIAKVVIKL